MSENLRQVMLGKPDSAVVVPELVRRCRQKVLEWREMARKYKTDGLKKQELADLWEEWEANRTNVELILQVSVQQPGCEQAAREVKKFMNDVSYEMAATDGAYRDFLCRGEDQCDLELLDEAAEWDDEPNDALLTALLFEYDMPDNELTRAVARVIEAAAEYTPPEVTGDMVATLEHVSELLSGAQEREQAAEADSWHWPSRFLSHT